MSFVIFGYFAVFFTTVSFLPQAIKTLKTRNTEPSFGIFGSGCADYLFKKQSN